MVYSSTNFREEKHEILFMFSPMGEYHLNVAVHTFKKFKLRFTHKENDLISQLGSDNN